MTNALAQNIENNKDSLLNSVMLNSNILTTTSQNQESKTADFSNLMNNVNAKTQEVQTKFVDKAVKSNTSSINKLALSSKRQTTQKSQEAEKNTVKQVLVNNEKNNKDLKQQNQAQSVEKSDFKNIQETKKEVKTIDTKNVEENQTTKTKKEDKSNLSDINNSSFVEPSPAFSLTESNESIESEINFEKIPTLLAITQDVNLEQNQTIKDEINKILSEIENSSDLISAVEELSEFIGYSDNFSQDFKNQLSETLNSLKDLAQNMDIESNIDFKDLANKLSQALNNDIDAELKANNDNDINGKLAVEDVQLNQKQDDFELLNEIKTQIEKFDDVKKVEIKDQIQKIEDTVENIKDSLKVLSNENIEKTNADKNEINEKLSDILTELKNIKDVKNLDLDKVLKDLREILAESKAETNNQANVISNIEFNKVDLKDNDNELFIKEIDIDKLSKLEKVDKNTMNEIIDTLSKINESQEDDNKIINEDIAKLIDKMKNSEDLAQNPKELVQNLQAIQNSIQQDSNKTTSAKKDENDTNIELFSEDNSIDLSEIFKNLNSANDEQFKNLNQDIELKTALKEEDNFDLNIDDLDFGNKVEINAENKTIDTKKVDIANLEENLKKAVQTQKLLDEMMMSAKASTSSQSGALSVADEVAKFAMDEISPLSANSNLQGSVLYDSASGQGALIKNAAQMFRSAQGSQNVQQNPNLDFSTNDIFNQIGDKLQQLKNGAEQKLTMVLRPNDLGRLSIELTSSKIGLTTNIMAQNEDVRAYIEKNIDTLRQQLTDAGINVNNIQIKTAGQDGATNYEGNQNFRGQHENNDNLNQQNNKQQHNKENKDRQDTLASMSNYDLHFAKDFSSILNKSISYNLN